MDENQVAAAPTTALSYDMARCPTGRKLYLLTVGGVGVLGRYDGSRGYVAWAALPERDRAAEAARGLRVG